MATVLKAALTGCVVAPGGGGLGSGTPAPQPQPVYQTQVGTAPFCPATRSDCFNLGDGGEFVREDVAGDGATCATGRKVLCQRQIN